MINTRRLQILAIASFAVLGLTRCSLAPDRPDPLPAESPAARALQTLMTGDEAAARSHADDVSLDAPPTTLFAAAEIDLWSGHHERAFERYLSLLERSPEHPLNRFGAARLYALRDDVVAYDKRLRPTLERVRFQQVEPLARVYLSLCAQHLHYRRWRDEPVPEPFSGDELGFPTRWTASPALSPWRLTDFDHVFGPETQPQLAQRYLSPYTAEAAPANQAPSRPYVANSIRLSPPFETDGVYYLETFANVQPAENGGPRDYWLYANGASAMKVWIDGELVIERREGRYGTSKRLRRVRLAPGGHRVLVKLAFQRGYRDWFDLSLLGDHATALAGSGVAFTATPSNVPAEATVELLGDVHLPSDLEPILLSPEQVDEASDAALYLTALAAYLDLQPEFFDPAWQALMDRHEGFAAGHALRADQLRTVWEIPSRVRDARAMSHVRRAHAADPDSLAHLATLVDWLRRQGGSPQEIEPLLARARQMATAPEGDTLRSIAPLVSWADYLSDRGWFASAEQAWRRVLSVDPEHCTAAQELQSLYAGRDHFPSLDQITPRWRACPLLEQRRLFRDDTRRDARLAHLQTNATRHPYDPSHQLRLARELTAQGQPDRAEQVLSTATERMPWALTLWSDLADRVLAQRGRDAALAVLDQAFEANGHAAWLAWRAALLREQIPLQELMPDGLAAAQREARRRPVPSDDAPEDQPRADYVSDDAYYVIDFSALQYLPDGSSISLTHSVVRVMTKGAIDRFGERSLPGDARVLLARTIKQDGSTLTPAQTPGKSTLSMPGLAEGDFVEFAYLQYDSAPDISHTYTEGTRFFFRMGEISSLHSEFVVLGDDLEFIRANNPPALELISTPAGDAARFLRRDSPRPRDEPHTPGWSEHLPWVQPYRLGLQIDPFELERRYQLEAITDAAKMSAELAAQIDRWRADTRPGTTAQVHDLFYDVAGWFNQSSLRDFKTDATHALIQRDGNPLLILYQAYKRAGIDAQIYVARPKNQHPQAFPIREFRTYGVPVLRVPMPDGPDAWLMPDGPDAMFGMMNPMVVGQPAVCLTCDEPVEARLPEAGFAPSSRAVSVAATLGADGSLTGTATLTYDGTRAARLRRSLRREPAPSARRKFIDRLLSSQLSGATLIDFDLAHEADPSKPMIVEATFARKNFARPTSDGRLRVETQLFKEPIASSYAELADRQTPMLLRFHRDHTYRLTLTLPDGYEVVSAAEEPVELESAFGRYQRRVELDTEPSRVQVETTMAMPIQRVAPPQYPDFQAWAVSVEQSALLRVDLATK